MAASAGNYTLFGDVQPVVPPSLTVGSFALFARTPISKLRFLVDYSYCPWLLPIDRNTLYNRESVELAREDSKDSEHEAWVLQLLSPPKGSYSLAEVFRLQLLEDDDEESEADDKTQYECEKRVCCTHNSDGIAYTFEEYLVFMRGDIYKAADLWKQSMRICRM